MSLGEKLESSLKFYVLSLNFYALNFKLNNFSSCFRVFNIFECFLRDFFFLPRSKEHEEWTIFNLWISKSLWKCFRNINLYAFARNVKNFLRFKTTFSGWHYAFYSLSAIRLFSCDLWINICVTKRIHLRGMFMQYYWVQT